MITRSELLLTLTSPMSHHDPAVSDKSNTLLFNRAKIMYRRTGTASPSTQAEIDRITGRFTVPGDVAPFFEGVGYYDFVAVAVVKRFLDMYNAGDGSGIFTGMSRYERLESRIKLAAVRCTKLRSWWDRLTSDLQVPIHGGDEDGDLLTLLSISVGAQSAVLHSLATEYRTIVSIARCWHTTGKMQSATYAAKAGAEVSAASIALTFNAGDLQASVATVTDIEIPAMQGNSARHQIVRSPGWLHLVETLGIRSAFPGDGDLPAGVEAIFENGGNMAGGAKQPSGPHGHAWNIRRTFPLLDLIGGCTDSFDLGESRLKPSVWLVCRENRDALEGLDSPLLEVSAYDMLTEVTQTRQASRSGQGQMIYNCEALAPGSQFLVRFTLDAFTPDLTKGAFAAALDTYLSNNPKLGGQSRAGFGSVEGSWLTPIEGADELRAGYESYLTENRDALLAAMTDGTLGTTARVVS